MAALKVKVLSKHFKKELTTFFSSRYVTPKSKKVELRYAMSSRFFKNLNDGHEHFENIAKLSGCNAILNLRYDKQLFGGYTVYSFKGDFAVVTESLVCTYKEKALDSINDVNAQIKLFESKFKQIRQDEEIVLTKQLKESKSKSNLLFTLLVVAGVCVMFGSLLFFKI